MSAAAALREARPRLAPGVAARRVTAGGEPVWVLANPATGRYFQLSPRLYALAGRLDGRLTVGEALAALPPGEEDEAALLDGLLRMAAAGLLVARGAALPPPPRDGLAPLRALVFRRVPLLDLGRALPLLGATLGPLASPGGALALALLLAAAAVALAGHAEEFAAQLARVTEAGLAEIALGYLVFVLAKLLHEAGHAGALARAAAAEGVPLRHAPFGVSFMFLLPAPYVDASAAWLLDSRARRAAVGLAGVATDLWIAGLAALAWAAVGAGALADRLFELMLICGVSSLLFNLNPLVRLDGYHVLADLLGVPNLMARAQAALGRVLLGPLGLAPRPAAGDLPGAAFALAAWLYRWTIYLAVFWMAAGLHPMLGLAVAVAVGVLFVAVPLLRLAREMPGAARERPAGLAAAAAAALALLAAATLVPLPRHLVAEGVVAGPGLAFAYPRGDGRLVAVAPAGPAGEAPLLALDNPETGRRLAQLRAEADSLALEARQARAAGLPRMDAAAERERAVQAQIARLEAERAAQDLRAPGAWWEPLRAERLAGAWVRRDDPRPLGAILHPGAPAEILLVLDQWDGPEALAALAAAAAVPLRLAGGTRASFRARPLGPALEAREALPSPALGTPGGGRIPARLDEREAARPLERVYELRLAPLAAAPPLPPGARVEARIALPEAPLAAQAWRRARQVVQRRLAV